MVADFTGRRHGVYFEVGMMLGLGRTVIWMSKTRNWRLHILIRGSTILLTTRALRKRKSEYDRIMATRQKVRRAVHQQIQFGTPARACDGERD